MQYSLQTLSVKCFHRQLMESDVSNVEGIIDLSKQQVLKRKEEV